MYVSKTNVCKGVQLERAQLLYDEWYNTQMYGEEVRFQLNKESSVSRDRYSSISNKQVTTPKKITMKAYPIIFNPSRYQQDKAGVSEQVTVIITTPMKSWTDNGEDIDSLIAIKGEVILRGKTYTITDKSLQRQVADTFVCINIGLFEK